MWHMEYNSRPRDEAEFLEARRLAFWHEVLAFLTGHPNRLLAWDETRDQLGLTGHGHRGMQSVPVASIVGSVGRYQDFDRAFMPVNDSLAQRWRSVARAHYNAVDLPPVKLYRIGEAYFVVDGHHRVSVARKTGVGFIDAEVVEVTAKVPVSDHLDMEELELKGEYVRFLEETRLGALRPDQRIEVTVHGAYARLQEHIDLHRQAMSQERGGAVTQDEAVCDWYDHIYLPLARVVREQRILDEFPHRTEADLYLWIVDHQHELRDQCGPGVVLERVAQHFAERHGRHLLRRATSAARDLVPNSECTLVTAQTPDRD
jgi:hypothetical protein